MTNAEYREKIIDMEPGPDLDRLVAGQVMGWRVHFRNTACYVTPEEENTVMTKVLASTDCWRPSKNVGQAWHVLEAVKAKGNDIQIKLCPGRGCRVTVEDDSHGPAHTIKADTFPEAMCKAALLDADWRAR